jgi:hypothetical protein
MEMIKFSVECVAIKLRDFIIESTLVKVARDSSEDPFNKKSSTDPAPKINSATF